MHQHRSLLLLICIAPFLTYIKFADSAFPIVTKNTPDTTIKSSWPSRLIQEGKMLKTISQQFTFTEGPAVDKNGNIFFTDQPNNKIWKYDINGNLSIFLDSSGRANGLYFDNKGNLLACADAKNELWSISPDKKITVLLKDFHGTKFNGPNDLWIDRSNRIYFTDPYYERPYWNRGPMEMSEKVYLLKKRGAKPAVVADNVKKPNGIIGTPDNKFLYVADIGDNKTYRYEIREDGSLVNPTVFCEQGSDGMTIDQQGNIYLTGDGVTVYNPKGEKIEHIPVPEPWTANVCFGGKERNLLFITASKGVYGMEMAVKGAF